MSPAQAPHLERAGLAAGIGKVPDTRSVVVAAGGQQLAVSAEGYAADNISVPLRHTGGEGGRRGISGARLMLLSVRDRVRERKRGCMCVLASLLVPVPEPARTPLPV